MKFSTMTMISSLTFLFVTACPPAQVPPGPGPAPAPPATCTAWCEHATALRCPAAEPTARGATCVVVCTNLQNSGVVVWDLRCRVAAKSCALADECEKGK